MRASPAAAAYVRARAAAFEPRATSAGHPGLLAALVVAQPYRPMSWRTGSRSVNYRRFFDIGDLVAVRQEVPGVFELTHGFLLELLDQPGVAGFRVDHIDGLRDPRGYLDRLRAEVGDSYIVVEKILAEGERIPESWPVDGTTGYELAADIDRLLVDEPGWALLQRAYESFSGEVVPLFQSLARASKCETLSALFPQEVRALARDLPVVPPQEQRIEGRRSAAADAAAIVDVTAALRVYRTYFGDPSCDAYSERWLQDVADTLRVDGAHALPDARPTTATEDVLRTIAKAPVAERALQWTMSWQQLTGAAAAKGVEDTALYRYPVLFSRNEVGAEPDAPPLDALAFHARMHRRHHEAPSSLNATSTHDSKRDEDARGRLHVLSERAAEWAAVLRRWHELNAPCLHRIGGRPVPSRREENLLYQSLVALWPLRAQDEAAATERICRYAVKALREAKLQTSWTDPAEEHEVAVESFVRSVLAPDGHGFLGDLRAFTRSIAASGAVNALAMTLLRVVVPGIPDTYQGTELWTLPRLVDPDNRVAVDFSLRRRLLDELDRREADDRTALLADLTTGWVDGRLKLYVLSRALRFRRDHESLFSSGGYVALDTRGSSAGTVFACARRRGDAWVVCLIPRLSDGLRPPGEL
ncbi:MAG TPA: malto-oligosyltrehalose synthase, partial [Dehalococcoidia bacterium]|nr:malto-oligosyltrehalose synthase [Dehalococcoidia bacterium]